MSNEEPKTKRSKKQTIELIAYSAFCIFGAYYCYHLKGSDGFLVALSVQEDMLLGMLPRITMALGIASLLWVLLDPEKLKKTIQKRKGWVKIVYATILGAVTPGGPSSAFFYSQSFSEQRPRIPNRHYVYHRLVNARSSADTDMGYPVNGYRTSRP